MKLSKDSLALYAVTSSNWLGSMTLAQQVEQAILGGVTFVQIREKHLSDADFIDAARAVKVVTARYHVPYVVNDNVEVALAVDADGVHVGQDDWDAAMVRQRIGSEKILGVSAQTVAQALKAEQAGADYLGVGAVFGTSTKADAVEVSYETLQAICRAVKIPVIAIGGIKAENIPQLVGSGIVGVAVVSAIFAQGDIAAAATLLKTAVGQLS